MDLPKRLGPEPGRRHGGLQHNTYDIEFYGPNTMTGSLYLAALQAGERIARHLGDKAAAAQYHSIYETGRARIERELWNANISHSTSR